MQFKHYIINPLQSAHPILASNRTSGLMSLRKQQQLSSPSSQSQYPNNPNRIKYHPFMIPPNLALCMKHRLCSQFGRDSTAANEEACPCCNSPPRSPLKIGCKVSQIYEVSEPAGYYFSYIKFIVIALIIMALINGAYTLYSIISQCSKDKSEQQNECLYVYGIPIPKIHIFFKIPLIALNVAVIVFLYIFAAYLFFRHAYFHQRNINSHEKPSDYSVLLSGFNHQNIQIDDLTSVLQQFDIQDIIYTHKIKKYMEWLSQKSKLDALQVRFRQRGTVKQIAKIDRKIRQLQDKMLHTKNKLTLGQDQQFRTDKVIVTFGDASHKKKFQQVYGLTMTSNIYHTFCGGSPLMLNNTAVFIEPLGEPSQILWQNLQITARSRYLRVLISNLVAVLLLLISFVMIVFLSKGEQDQGQVGDVLMSIVFAVLIELVNELLSFAIDKFTRWEGRYTMTGENSMKLYKNCAGFFLNTTLLPFMLFVFDLFDPEEDDIIRNILSIFFISNLVSPYIGLLLQPQTVLKIFRRKQITSKGNESLVTQIKANDYFQKMDFMLDERYALIEQLVMNCMFYAAIFPIGIIITILGMVVAYWSSKWWILKYCSLPKFSYKLGRHVNILSCFFPTIYAFGYAANLYMVRKEAEFDRSYSIYMAALTCPITLLFILFGQRIAIYFIRNHRKSVLNPAGNKAKYLISYKSLNPTSFIHDNLSSKAQSQGEAGFKQPHNMWDKLVSYVAAKESGILMNDDLDEQTSSRRSSRLSINQQQDT